jgi:hypothetical protein
MMQAATASAFFIRIMPADFGQQGETHLPAG